jgi:hypothetical protein
MDTGWLQYKWGNFEYFSQDVYIVTAGDGWRDVKIVQSTVLRSI